MPQVIEFEGVEHEFPDDVSDEEILGFLSREVTATRDGPAVPPAGSTPAPASNVFTDLLRFSPANPVGQLVSALKTQPGRRALSGIAEASAVAATGVTRLGEFAGGGALGSALGLPSPGEPIRDFLTDVQERAKEDYGVDPAQDTDLVSKFIQGATSLVPIAASGPAAPLTAAGLMGESQRQDAEEHGATEGQKTAAFAGGAALGVASEALLGLPALLRGAKAAAETTKTLTRQIGEQAVKQTVRESAQEALEQVGGNVLANTVVGYDPERPTMQGVGEAALMGALIGGPTGAVVQAAASLDAQAQPETTPQGGETLENERQIEEGRETLQVTPDDTTVETPEAPGIAGENAPSIPSKTYFHGTRETLEGALRPGLGRDAKRFLHEEGIWFAPNRGKDFDSSWISDATRYSGDSGTIVSATLNIKNPYFGDVNELIAERINAKWLREHGYDAFVDNKSGSGLVAVLDSSQVVETNRTPASEPAPPSVEITRQQAESPDAAAVESIKTQHGVDTETAVSILAEARNRFSKSSAQPEGQEPAPAPVGAETAPGPASLVAPHLKTDKDVQEILDNQPAAPEAPAMKVPALPTEAGAAGGTGGKRPPKVPAIGTTPQGDRNWLRIPAWYKRIGRGLFTEGARHVLDRTKNRVGKALARATRRHVDVEQELFGQHEKILRDAVRGIPNNRQEALWTEVSQHVRDVENGRPAAPLAPDAQRVLDAWYDVGRSTGDIARANNVMVWDATRGAYRPMGTVTNYIPRMFSREVESALRDPEKNPTLFNNLAQAIATHRGISLPDAAAELQKVAGRFSSNDFHGNLELARQEQLPEIFYEYDLRTLAARYLPAFSERMGQIIAYGQRLGPREQPMRMNLWDFARRESRDETTQQWLNAAEDQASGFRPKNEFERNARRLQAIGNATLLSDPTTTVVRNMLSGLSVTAERFGVVRALKQFREAARTASGLDAREIGAMRDDIGSFLGAEQLGDSALDNTIRRGQQTALKLAGFSGSENFVRTHGAMTASAFARDAANALSTNPNSKLAKEALRYFKSLDVDPEAIVAEGGNWKTGPETRKFIRSAVRESQGGYRFDQVPIWGGTTVGRFLYQYGRWGIQRAGDIFRNTIRPAIGETVEFRGTKMTHRDVLPLIRLGMLTVGLGEGFAAIAALLFGRDRRDASLSEIGEALSEDEAQAVALMGERAINDVLMAGTLGLIGQPVDYFKALKDQTRLKNPLDPPSIAGVKTLIDLAAKAKDQGGTLTKRDLLAAATGLARGPKNVTDVARNAADEKLFEAQNDQRTLRNAARRWAKTEGMDVASKVQFDSVRKALHSPVFESLNDALLTGDADKARKIAADFVEGSKDKKKARAAIKASAEGRHPFRAGPFASEKYQKQFMQWAEKNLSEVDLAQIRRVMDTYEKTRREAGL